MDSTTCDAADTLPVFNRWFQRSRRRPVPESSRITGRRGSGNDTANSPPKSRRPMSPNTMPYRSQSAKLENFQLRNLTVNDVVLRNFVASVFLLVSSFVSCFQISVGIDSQPAARGSVLMLSRGQEYDVSVGSRLVLDCEFHMDDYKMFDNPTIWEKNQLDERTRINIMAIVQEPFASTRRFEVTFVSNKPRHLLRLAIKEITLEDTGNYTCEIRGRKSTVLNHVTHTVLVRWPLTALYLTADAQRNPMTSSTSTSGSLTSLVLDDGQAASIECIVQSGCPAPELSMRVGSSIDVTSQFGRTEHPVAVGGERGLRTLTCTVKLLTALPFKLQQLVATGVELQQVSLWSWASAATRTGRLRTRSETTGRRLVDENVSPAAGTFVAQQVYDGMPLRCSASSGPNRIDANWTEVGLVVQYAPRVTCEPAIAELAATNVHLDCRVQSRPSPTSLYWVVDSNGTIVSGGGQAFNEYWTVTDIGDGTLQTSLFLKRVTSDSFRKYLLVAENAIGSTKRGIELVRDATQHKIRLTTSPSLRRPPVVPDSSLGGGSRENGGWKQQHSLDDPLIHVRQHHRTLPPTRLTPLPVAASEASRSGHSGSRISNWFSTSGSARQLPVTSSVSHVTVVLLACAFLRTMNSATQILDFLT